MKRITSLLKMSAIALIALLSFTSNGQSTAIYDISITTTWTTAQHGSVPGNAHWSPIVGATHADANEFMEIGAPASTGIKNVAETGNNTTIKNEINAAINEGVADQLLEKGLSPFGAISSAEMNSILVSEHFPLISLVSMIAPSPDWFIAVNSLNLRSNNPTMNNGWKDTFSMAVFVYDSATDGGMDYTASNNPNSSPGAIFMRTSAPTNGNKMATISFTYNSSTLSINEISTIDNINVFPNPSNGNISIENLQNSDIKTIEIFNILGSRVYNETLKANTNKVDLNLNNVTNKGVYLLKLQTNNGGIKTRKLIIE